MNNLYTFMKVFHFKDKIDSLPEFVDSILAPIHIRIKPTNVCNHNCWYCAYKADNLHLGKDMQKNSFIPREKMFEIIDDLVEIGVKAVSFSGGGEPFCYPYLLDAVKRLSKSFIKFASLTNGSKLEGEIAEMFSQYGTWLRISIDGWDDDSYSAYRGVSKNEFNKVIKNMENFKKLGGDCYLGVSLIVDNKNYPYVYELLVKFKDIGVDSVKVSACIVSEDVLENNRYHKPFFDKVKEQIYKAKKDFKEQKFEIFDAYHELSEKFQKDYNWCPYLQTLPVIGADLNIYPCQDKAYDLETGLIGSIKDRRFKDFWFSDKDKFFKINPMKHCNHHCVANMKNKLILDYLNTDEKHLD